MSRHKRDPRAGIRVEWWSPAAQGWLGIGPWFVTEREAEAFMDTLAFAGRTVRIKQRQPAQLDLEDSRVLPGVLDAGDGDGASPLVTSSEKWLTESAVGGRGEGAARAGHPSPRPQAGHDLASGRVG